MTTEAIQRPDAFFAVQEGPVMGYASHAEFRYELFSPLGRERLWEAFRDKDQRARWFGDIDFGEAPLQPFVFRAGPGHTHAGEIIEYEAGRFVKFSWVEVGRMCQNESENAIATLEFKDAPGGGSFVYTQAPVNKVTKYGSGTHAHIDMLKSFLEGEQFDFRDRFFERYEYWIPKYAEVFGPLKD